MAVKRCIISTVLCGSGSLKMLFRQVLSILLLVSTVVAAPVFALDSRAYIDRAVALIQESKYSLARTYLAPAVIDPRLTAGERSRAYYLRGYSYFAQRLFVSASKDYHRALEFNPGNPGVSAALGDLYFRGLGVDRDAVLAVTLIQSAAEKGHPGAQFQLGFAYLEGEGVEQNLEVARQWLGDAAEQGNAPAMNYLARSYRKGYADPPQPQTAREWYEKAHAAGAVDALVSIAFMYQKGEFGEPDEARAAALFAEAAQAGSSAARVSLGHLYMTGRGVEKDAEKALEHFELAAEQQNPAGYLGLAHLYEAGLGVDRNLQTAKTWYERAANHGLAPAQLRLVYLLLAEGESVRAMHWLSEAAKQELPQAHNDYAWLLATSSNAEIRDGDLAVEYAQRAVAKVKNPAYLDTLAAAYAEVGQYTEAIAAQKEAIALVEDGEAALLAELETHLAAYETGQPWRD